MRAYSMHARCARRSQSELIVNDANLFDSSHSRAIMSSAANGSGSYFGWCWRLLCRTKPAMASQVDDPAPATQIELSPVRGVVGRPTLSNPPNPNHTLSANADLNPNPDPKP